MWTIFGKGFAHAQVHTNWVPKAHLLWCMHESLCKTLLPKTSPYGQVAFTIYSGNFFKKDESTCLALWVNETLHMIYFTHSRLMHYEIWPEKILKRPKKQSVFHHDNIVNAAIR